MRPSVIPIWLTVLTAGSMTLGPGPGHATGESRLQVDYRPPRLSVTATDVGLLELLGAIGVKVGFTVAGARAPSPSVTVAIEGASVDDVLRQLLRTENHTILYRRETDAVVVVDRIVLQGAQGERGGVPVASTGPASAPDPAAIAPNVPGVAASPSTAAIAAPVPPHPAGGEAADDGVRIGDMLKAQALAGLPPQQGTGAEPPSAAVPAGVEETLAIATRRAQQGVTSLVEGLERATQALQQQSTAPPK